MDLTAFRSADALGARRDVEHEAGSAPQLRALSKLIFGRSYLAGRYARVLVRPQYWTIVGDFTAAAASEPQPATGIIWSHLGSGKSHTLISAAFEAERLWRASVAELQVRRRTEIDFDLVLRDEQHLYLVEAKGFGDSANRPTGADKPLASVTLSGILSGNGPIVAPRTAKRTDWLALVTESRYWRRAADELWRLISVTAQAAPEPTAPVVLDTSPCGIRRLTAVRVPRAPGCASTTSFPNSSALAAA